ncbi:malonyl-CoA decarboxylase [Limnohabitans sp. T6-5]|uniref:malonyl-CoA decarboxylase n=1 Tax=Limnohabitans sp. T6-5 TaxID=1100724 RepID=UPI000D36D80F|nr:malonyl-CoA decarboxylase [Limnohabitans sp. T6-5]PUE08936.1 malonyl-CoA decarboxylase [Limnohabitans sp. T6-5]
MNTSEWIGRKVAAWLPAGKLSAEGVALAVKPVRAGSQDKPEPTARSSRERLNATLRQKEEALSPRVLRRTLAELQAIVDPSVSEVEGGRRAKALAQWYSRATPQERQDCWLLMSEQFAPDASKVKAAREHYEAAVGTPDEGVAEIRLRKALISPRTRLLQRFAVFPEGMRFLVDLRAQLLPVLKGNKRVWALEAELENLFTTWFDVAFLELRRISWDSPASLVEKLIKYEAVHDIKSWGDVKNRLDSDRRCYGFFHPSLPDEPLIFVEVAFMNDIASSITPLLDESAAAVDLAKATTAIFYSISNTQTGLKGVSFGDSLIKRVVETLRADFPKLKTFATLSPIPGFRAWLTKNADRMLAQTPEKMQSSLGRAVGFEPPTAEHVLSALDNVITLNQRSVLRQWLLACAAQYLGKEQMDGRPTDPVARFHLGNGARVEQVHWSADLSAKGLKQSWGLMVNYLYDLRKIDKHRQMLAAGKVPVSSDVDSLYL